MVVAKDCLISALTKKNRHYIRQSSEYFSKKLPQTKRFSSQNMKLLVIIFNWQSPLTFEYSSVSVSYLAAKQVDCLKDKKTGNLFGF